MRILAVEKLLTIFLEEGLLSRGIYADLLEIDRCDVDDKIKEVNEKYLELNGNLQINKYNKR